MFQFPGLAFIPYVFRYKYLLVISISLKTPKRLPNQSPKNIACARRPQSYRDRRWVSPFGNPWIKACSQLPTAYRSVPRPSSPLSAKASTTCTYSLDPITLSSLVEICRLQATHKLCADHPLAVMNNQMQSQRVIPLIKEQHNLLPTC